MPYIKQELREFVRRQGPVTCGELTYFIQQALHDYISRNGSPSYQTLAECLGALEGAKLDLIERVVRPYEEAKREDNGDVWDDDVTGVGR